MPESSRAFRGFVQRSIFLKLFLIYVATTLALILAVSGYSRLVLRNDEMFKQTRGRMMAHHLTSLIDQLGTPPDRQRASHLAQQLGIQIRMEGAGAAWTTDDALPGSSALSAHHAHPDLGMQTGRYRGRRFVIMDRGATRFLFFFAEVPELDMENVAIIIGMIALILGASYLVVRWLFRPLDWLAQGVGEIAKGNLTHQIPIRSRDELGQLTGALNDMVSRIREMFRARDRLLLDVSHELRSPLTRIKVALEFIRDESAKEKIQQEVRELETMVTELLESERLNSDYGGVILAETDLVPLVRELSEVCNQQEPGVRVVAAPSNVYLKVDRRRVRAALRNVLENALKHSQPEYGPVEIRIETDTDTVRVSVRDHGPGIPSDERALIFEPFYRVDKSRTRTTGGYGLGLSLAKKIMTAHGGDILVTGGLGQGSTFTLAFPFSKESHAGAKDPNARSSGLP
ncbi:MAG: ATP-binding protein [Nitrospiraceae bacterium]